MARGRYRKLAYHTGFQRQHLRAASGVHVLTEDESTDLFNCANSENVFCIPNGIDLDDFPDRSLPTIANKAAVTLGYLGRLSPEKNLDALCHAFVATNRDGRLLLKLAGPESEYGRRLVDRYGSYGVEWVGPKFGRDKTQFLRSVNIFVHPSLCDVFSIAAMEVLALGTPLLITRTAKASYFYGSSSFFMCEPTAYGIERGLNTALSRNLDWIEMAARGRSLIERRLNWAVAAEELLAEYQKILIGGKK
jgi:glycosyltransferase involved in cell wall biosynthesis